MGFPNPAKEAKKAIDKVIKPAVRLGEKVINKATEEADEAIWKGRRAAWAAVMSAKEQAVDKVEDAAREAEDGLTEKLPELAKDAVEGVVDELRNAPVEAGLKKAAGLCRSFHDEMAGFEEREPKLVDAINDTGFSFGLQAVVSLGLSYSQFYQRSLEVAGVLDRYANEGLELRRRDIIGLVRACGPTRVSLGAGAELSIGVQLGVDGEVDMPLELFLARA